MDAGQIPQGPLQRTPCALELGRAVSAPGDSVQKGPEREPLPQTCFKPQVRRKADVRSWLSRVSSGVHGQVPVGGVLQAGSRSILAAVCTEEVPLRSLEPPGKSVLGEAGPQASESLQTGVAILFRADCKLPLLEAMLIHKPQAQRPLCPLRDNTSHDSGLLGGQHRFRGPFVAPGAENPTWAPSAEGASSFSCCATVREVALGRWLEQ
ncbi:hypothetical protein MC885_002455 [Smutsia gigantea]|nr:hypothetical protein MC885_002455 [Smutsia gigantea]